MSQTINPLFDRLEHLDLTESQKFFVDDARKSFRMSGFLEAKHIDKLRHIVWLHRHKHDGPEYIVFDPVNMDNKDIMQIYVVGANESYWIVSNKGS